MDANNSGKKKNKVVEYITGKGFYTVIGICLSIVVAAAWLISTKYGNSGTQGVKSSSKTSSASTSSEYSQTYSQEHGLSSQIINSQPVQNASEDTHETGTESENAEAVDAKNSEAAGQQTAAQTDILFVLPCNGKIIREHSDGLPVYSPTLRDWRVHNSVDIAGEIGTPVRSMAAGVVTSVVEDLLWGTKITIAHEDGYESVYCNLGAKPTVAKDSVVECGQVIGSIGNTAQSEIADEPHLHFSLSKDGVSVDPVSVIASMAVN